MWVQAKCARDAAEGTHPVKLRPDARSIAVHVITRVLREDAYAAAVLNGALDCYPDLDIRERALATELVYGTLRAATYLENQLGKGAPRGLKKLDDAVRAELWMAAYQVLFLDRVPNFAAVSEAVGRIRGARGPKLAGFANALLRRLCGAHEGVVAPTDVAVHVSPPWLREALERTLGVDGARAMLMAPTPAPIGLRVRPGEDRMAWLEKLRFTACRRSVGATFELGAVSPLAILAWNVGDPEHLPGWAEGAITVQEEGAQLVALALGAAAGDRVLDACAGRGNKTSLLAELSGVRVDAADLHQAKLDQLGAELARLGVRHGQSFAVDWSVGPGLVPTDYDRVLVDAPCTGTGTLRRRPELGLRRRGTSDIEALSELQCRIALQAATRVRVGGVLIYAVCSVLREEAENIIARLVAGPSASSPLNARLEPSPFPPGPAAQVACGATSLRLLPHVHGTDGYFLASFRRVG